MICFPGYIRVQPEEGGAGRATLSRARGGRQMAHGPRAHARAENTRAQENNLREESSVHGEEDLL